MRVFTHLYQVVECNVTWQAVEVSGSGLEAKRMDGATVSLPSAPLRVELENSPTAASAGKQAACLSAHCVLACKVPLPQQQGSKQQLLRFDENGTSSSVWPQGQWGDLDLTQSSKTFGACAWFTERVEVPPPLRAWTPVTVACHGGHGGHGGHGDSDVAAGAGPAPRCELCAPVKPQINWYWEEQASKTKGSKGKKAAADGGDDGDGDLDASGNPNRGRSRGRGRIVPREDVEVAGSYERGLKQRPKVFKLRLRQDGGEGTLQVGVNVVTLVHRAQANLLAAMGMGMGGGSGDGDGDGGRYPLPACKYSYSWRLVEQCEDNNTNNTDANSDNSEAPPSQQPEEQESQQPSPGSGSGSRRKLPDLSLTSNRHDRAHAQPPSFTKHHLRYLPLAESSVVSSRSCCALLCRQYSLYCSSCTMRGS